MRKFLKINLTDLRQTFDYNPETGVFLRKTNLKPAPRAKFGYVQLNIKGNSFMAHRCAWLLEKGSEPPETIDHINGIRDDNRICNLRSASFAENVRNTDLKKSNKTGFKGVSKFGGGFRAQIRNGGTPIYLGTFKTIEKASEAYKAAAKALHGDFTPIEGVKFPKYPR